MTERKSGRKWKRKNNIFVLESKVYITFAKCKGGVTMDYDVLWNEDDLMELEALNEILNVK